MSYAMFQYRNSYRRRSLSQGDKIFRIFGGLNGGPTRENVDILLLFNCLQICMAESESAQHTSYTVQQCLIKSIITIGYSLPSSAAVLYNPDKSCYYLIVILIVDEVVWRANRTDLPH